MNLHEDEPKAVSQPTDAKDETTKSSKSKRRKNIKVDIKKEGLGNSHVTKNEGEPHDSQKES